MALMVAIIVLGPVLILGQIMAVAVLECLLLAWQQYHKLLAMCRPHQAAAVGSQPTHPKFDSLFSHEQVKSLQFPRRIHESHEVIRREGATPTNSNRHRLCV